MLRARVIPCLLVKNKGLVKTVRFKDPKYVGDPINAVRIFNEKEVDELVVLDIDASAEDRPPDFKMIENLAVECRMPLCYGGGIKSAEDARRIVALGVEKVAVSAAALQDYSLLKDISKAIGRQSVVVVLDVKRNIFGKYEVYIKNATIKIKQSLLDVLSSLEQIGVGEVLVNSIDNDGMMNGYDIKLIEIVRGEVSVPITVLGGAGRVEDIFEVIKKFGVIGVAAGSLFVFKGVYKAVLINYLSAEQKANLWLEDFYPQKKGAQVE